MHTSNTPTRKLTTPVAIVMVVAAVVSLAAAPLRAGGPLTVVVESGRAFVGHVDSRTDGQRLWLRSGDGAVELLRPIAWSRIDAVEYEGRRVDGEKARELIEAQRSGDARIPGRIEKWPAAPESKTPKSTTEEATSETMAAQAQTALGMYRRVRSVQLDAHLANWDADVEADGLMVYISPLDASGQLVPVDGTVDITLFATQRRDLDQAVHSRGTTIERVGRWTRRLSADEFGINGAVLKLPFQAIQGEFDIARGPAGIVNIRLAAAGHGVFEDSLDDVRIRRYSGIRDILQRKSGKRFLSAEETGPGH